jgi:hypothetical protein
MRSILNRSLLLLGCCALVLLGNGAHACATLPVLSVGNNNLDLTQTVTAFSYMFNCGDTPDASGFQVAAGSFTADVAGFYHFSTWFYDQDRDTVMSAWDLLSNSNDCVNSQLQCNDDSPHSPSASLRLSLTAGQRVAIYISRFSTQNFVNTHGSLLVARASQATCNPVKALALSEPYMAPSTLSDMQFFDAPNPACMGLPVAQIVSFTAPKDSWYAFYANVTQQTDMMLLDIRIGGCSAAFSKCALSSPVGNSLGLSTISPMFNYTLNASQTVYVLMGALGGSLVSPSIQVGVVSSFTLSPTAAPTTLSPTMGSLSSPAGSVSAAVLAMTVGALMNLLF